MLLSSSKMEPWFFKNGTLIRKILLSSKMEPCFFKNENDGLFAENGGLIVKSHQFILAEEGSSLKMADCKTKMTKQVRWVCSLGLKNARMSKMSKKQQGL